MLQVFIFGRLMRSSHTTVLSCHMYQALFAMQKILVNRIPMLFFEPRAEYVPAVRRFATAWKQLWVCQHWPVRASSLLTVCAAPL